jgi:hypothetical protein
MAQPGIPCGYVLKPKTPKFLVWGPWVRIPPGTYLRRRGCNALESHLFSKRLRLGRTGDATDKLKSYAAAKRGDHALRQARPA